MAKGWTFVPIEVGTVKGPDFIGCTPTEQATWLKLLVQCAMQDSDGVIPDCRSWGDRRWQQTCQVTLAEVQMQSPLWKWHEDNLVVKDFPSEAFANLKSRREQAKLRQAEARRLARLAKEAEEARAKQECHANVTAHVPPIEKGREGKGREEKRSEEKVSIANAPGAEAEAYLPLGAGEGGLSRIPSTEDELRTLASNLRIDFDYAIGRWGLVKSRGGRDASGKPIGDFGHYLLVGWDYEQKRRNSGTVDAGAAEERIAEIAQIIKRMPRPNPDVLPEQFQAYMAKRAKLEEEAALLKSKIPKFK